MPIAAVELKIESNAGNPDYTCLYKFRVHGHIFNNNEATTGFVNNDKEVNMNQQQSNQQLNDKSNN